MTLDEYIDLNIELLKIYRENPSLPMSRDAIKVCEEVIKKAKESGKFDEVDAEVAKRELEEIKNQIDK